MRRFSLVIPLLIVLLVGLVMVGRGSLTTLAQEGTPSANDFEQPPEA
jgi:Sec-independent protein translocase protein TatA